VLLVGFSELLIRFRENGGGIYIKFRHTERTKLMPINAHIGFPERQDPKWDHIAHDYRIGSYIDINNKGEERLYVGMYRVWYKEYTKDPMIYDKEILNINWTDPKALLNEVRKLMDAFRQPVIPLEETFHQQTN
jgi:hypothetical protein